MSKSYPTRPAAEPLKHQVYTKYLGELGLENGHLGHLIKRGLTSEHINKARYATKKSNNSNHTSSALGALVNEFGDKLKGIPGFFKDENTGHRSHSGATGLLIPVRDLNGKISSLIIRKDDGKKGPKYMAFSSAGKPEGEKVWQTTHCPIIKGTAREVEQTTVRITEGILKADVATALGDVYCLGMHGLNIQKDLPDVLEELEASILRVALDAGEDDNKDIIRAKANLIKLTQDIGIDVVVETWDPEHGKGIDDVLAAGHADKITQLSEEEIESLMASADEINPSNGQWLYIVATERFMNKETFQTLKKSQFADKFLIAKLQDVNDLLASGFDQVDSLTFLPNGPEIVVEDGQRKLNEWRDPKIEPLEGDVSVFLEHVEYLFPDKKGQDIFLDWLTYNIQNPGKKIMWALVLVGGQGIGKSFFAFILKNLVGEHNTSSPSNEQIHEKYTDWQKRTQIVIIEELMAPGRRDLINRLKPAITELMTMIREMYMTPYPYPNRFNIIAFTNYDNALLVDDDDRRYGVLKSEAQAKDSAYYDRLWSWAEQPESAQALLHYFLNERDISHFKPHARAPETQAKLDMIKASRSLLEQWVIEGIEDKCWPFNRKMVVIRHLCAEDVCPHSLKKFGPQKWAEALKKAGVERYPKAVTLSDKSRATVWVIRNKEMLLEQPPAKIKELYEKEERLAVETRHKATNPLDDMKPI